MNNIYYNYNLIWNPKINNPDEWMSLDLHMEGGNLVFRPMGLLDIRGSSATRPQIFTTAFAKKIKSEHLAQGYASASNFSEWNVFKDEMMNPLQTTSFLGDRKLKTLQNIGIKLIDCSDALTLPFSYYIDTPYDYLSSAAAQKLGGIVNAADFDEVANSLLFYPNVRINFLLDTALKEIYLKYGIDTLIKHVENKIRGRIKQWITQKSLN